ncbi:MAG: hypothetical protein JKY26_17440 [Pseudomonas sp.]|nr:hypothetical protein [Pseudomonas sp.]
MSVVNVPGVRYSFPGGKVLVIPALSLGAMEQLLDRINAAMTGNLSMEGITTVIDATHTALLRNYPDITRAEVADMIDLSNMADVLNAVMNASGMEPKTTDDDSAGEAEAPSTGASSTPT